MTYPITLRDPGSHRKKLFFKRVAVLFLPIAALIVALALFLYRSELERDRIVLSSRETLGVRTGAEQMMHAMDTIARNLLYLAGTERLRQAIDRGDATSLQMLADDSAKFLRSMGIFDKVRWIDETGYERVRVNYAKGRTAVVRGAQLQHKEDRYYFNDTMKLGRGEIYISPFDLNMEFGEIERPFKPIIRLATPLFSSNGKRRGILVLSYLGKVLLDEFARNTRSVGDHVMILNRDGFWIKSPDPGDEWDFMFSGQKSLGQRNPTAWRRILSSDEGQFEEGGDLWTFSTVYPLGLEKQRGAAGGSASADAPVYLWKVVARIPQADLALGERKPFVNTMTVALVLLMATFIGSWLTADAWARRKTAEDEERRTAARMGLLMDSMGEGVFGIDREGKCTFINPAALEILGYTSTEVINVNADALFHHDRRGASAADGSLCPILATAVTGRAWSGDEQFIRKDGTNVPVQVCATPIRGGGEIMGIVVVFQDRSERVRLEERVRQSQKLEAIGRLAGGVAHDFNNVLTSISGHAHLLSLAVPEADPLREDIDQIVASSERARLIVQRLVAFSRRQALHAVPHELDALVRQQEPHVREMLGGRCGLELRLDGHGLQVLADRSQLEVALENIIENAKDALPGGGTITVSTETVEAGDPRVRKLGLAGQGAYGVLSVQDNGAGMDEQTRQMAFDPFFTTKEVDEGAGLGLAVVYGIMEQLHGAVDVQSGEGAGTRVSLFLPACGESVPDAAKGR